MKKFFDQDNPFNTIMTGIFDLAILNICWFICCIPIITIGASTSALYSVTLKMVRNEEGEIAKSFFTAFKANFKESIPETLIFIGVVVLLAFDVHYFGINASSGGGALAYGGIIVLTVFATAFFSYVFPLIAKFKNTARQTMSNAWRLAATHLPQTLLITAINVAPFLWLMFSPETFSYVFYIWLILGFAASAFVDSLFLVGIFDELIPDEDEEDHH